MIRLIFSHMLVSAAAVGHRSN